MYREGTAVTLAGACVYLAGAAVTLVGACVYRAGASVAETSAGRDEGL